MAQLPLPPPPLTKDPGQDRWFVLLWKRINSAGQILWSYLDFSGSDLADLEKRSYHDLQDKPPIPVMLDDGLDEAFIIPGPQGRQGPQGERGPMGFALDGEDASSYPMPWEGIKGTDLYRGIITENGVVDRSGSTMSFDNSTRTFTITPTGTSFEVWSYGNKVEVTSAKSVSISNTEGQWAFYFDAFGTLTAQFGFDSTLITQKGWVCLAYWDATNLQCILLADERHGRTMDSQTHLYLHNTRHTVYQTGLALGNFTADGSGDLAVHAEFSCTGGTIWDEDIQLVITAGSPQTLGPVAQIPVYYRTGAAGNWRRIAPGNFPLAYAQVGTRANWNQFTAGAWQLTEVANNDYVLMHYFATDDVGSNQVIGMVGQATYSTLAAAQAGARDELASLVTSGLPSLEFVAIGTVIFQTSTGYLNTPKSRIRTIDTGANYVDWRSTTTVSLGGSPSVGPTGATGATGPAIGFVIDTDSGEPVPMLDGPMNPSSLSYILRFAAAHG